jgi:putative hydrolase of the HAD superfamily
MSPRPPLDAVLFDAGGTLVRLDFEWMSELLAELGVAIAPDRIRRGEVEGRRRYDASRAAPPPGGGDTESPLGGGGDVHAYFGGTLEAAGVPAAVVPGALDRFARRHAATGLWTRPVEGARAALDGVLALGVRAAAVSNSDGRAAKHLADCGVIDGLEFVVDSELVGVEKPDPRIFAIALGRLGVAAERALYVGDIVSVDLAGARAAGMHAVLLDPHGDYAPPGAHAIARIADLPDWIAHHFDTAPDGRSSTLPTGGHS